MIVAIASIGEEISPHFGHSKGCTVYDIEKQRIIGEKFIANPLMKLEEGLLYKPREHNNSGCSCRFFAVFLLHEIELDLVVTGHIGEKASQLFRQRGVKVISKVKGKIDDYLTRIPGGNEWQ